MPEAYGDKENMQKFMNEGEGALSVGPKTVISKLNFIYKKLFRIKSLLPISHYGSHQKLESLHGIVNLAKDVLAGTLNVLQ